MTPALFLDRDGIINIDRDYVHKREDFEFVPGIFALCRIAQQFGRRLHVVTNQAGIARGYYTEQDFDVLTRWMCGQFAAQGVTIEAVHYCPFHPDHGVGDYRRASLRRKPQPGMIVDAAAQWHLDLTRSAMIGDQITDMQAAAAAGVRDKILVPRDDAEKMKGQNGLDGIMLAPDVAGATHLLHQILLNDS